MQATLKNSHSPFIKLLPKAVAIAHVTEDQKDSWRTGLRPDERTFIQKAVKKRQEEFTAGRNCARQAIQALGGVPASIISGQYREPIFPAPFLGSISHTEHPHASQDANNPQHTDLNKNVKPRYCAAAVFDTQQTPSIASIGIDIETNLPLESTLLNSICTHNDQRHIDQLKINFCKTMHWSKIAFSAKESFYKAQFMYSQRYLDFLEVEIIIKPKADEQQTHPQSTAIIHSNSTGYGQFTIKVKEKHHSHDMDAQDHHGFYYWDRLFIYTAIAIQSL